MKKDPLTSIILNNYNYGRFLRDAIDSAVNQTYANIEIIVVDDGSTHNSAEIIADYANLVIPVIKENGGQASAFNAGFQVSRGQVVVFLDSDDALLPTAMENAVKLFHQAEVVKVHWPLWRIDAVGKKTGELFRSTRWQRAICWSHLFSMGPIIAEGPVRTSNQRKRMVTPVPGVSFSCT